MPEEIGKLPTKLQLVEIDRPRSLGEKLAEYLARPPQPILRFYGPFEEEPALDGRHVTFAVRNGLPIPLPYGMYVTIRQNSAVEYISKTDHIGPFSTDDWRLTLDSNGETGVEIRVGLVPFEILTDRVQIVIGK
ncbi:unnamed protein product [marine sediment metagenome]|uniref:Uncharacterized protein n=1 Tax=marine sediment metagenome TaxID=412755 RepID=X1DIC5_9ZZZZ